ncbi:hypothetical protein Tco_1510391, partial [Tanacetum coccineum]
SKEEASRYSICATSVRGLRGVFLICHGIAKVDLLVYEVGLKVRVMGLFVGAGVKESDG